MCNSEVALSTPAPTHASIRWLKVTPKKGRNLESALSSALTVSGQHGEMLAQCPLPISSRLTVPSFGLGSTEEGRRKRHFSGAWKEREI